MINIQDLSKNNVVYRQFWNPHPETPSYMYEPVIINALGETFANVSDLGKKEKMKIGYDMLFPIPLTEKILLDSKFKHIKGSAIVIFEKEDFSVEIHLNAEYAGSGFYFKGKQIPCKSTIYIHDLQNAYYMATGQQLNIVIK